MLSGVSLLHTLSMNKILVFTFTRFCTLLHVHIDYSRADFCLIVPFLYRFYYLFICVFRSLSFYIFEIYSAMSYLFYGRVLSIASRALVMKRSLLSKSIVRSTEDDV